MSDAEDWEQSSSFLLDEHLARYLHQSSRSEYGSNAGLTSEESGFENGADQQGLRQEGINSLRRAWESSQRSTKDDWAEWMRNFSIELLKQSPSRALRACAPLSQARLSGLT